MHGEPPTTRWALDPIMAVVAIVFGIISIGAAIADMSVLASLTAIGMVLAARRARYWGKKGFTTWR